MKLFLRQLLTIIIIAIAISALLLWGYATMNQKQISRIQAKALILGDSQAQNGFDTQFFPKGTVNYANSAEPLYLVKEKLKVLSTTCALKQVIIPVTHLNLRKTVERNWILNDTVFNEKSTLYYGLWEMKKPIGLKQTLHNQINQLNKLVYKSIYTMERKVLLRKENILGGFVPNLGVFDTKLKCESSMNKDREFSKLQLQELKAIQQICKKKKIQLILVSMPKYCKDQLDLKRIFKLDSNTVYIDCHDWYLGRADCFADFNHLNKYGAALFSKRFSALLRLNSIHS